jgi:hypothetical protein
LRNFFKLPPPAEDRCNTGTDILTFEYAAGGVMTRNEGFEAESGMLWFMEMVMGALEVLYEWIPVA